MRESIIEDQGRHKSDGEAWQHGPKVTCTMPLKGGGEVLGSLGRPRKYLPSMNRVRPTSGPRQAALPGTFQEPRLQQ